MLGFTLIELVAVLTLFAVGASAMAPTARRLADLAAVTTAREEMVGVFGKARVTAMRAGGATVTVIAQPTHGASLIGRGAD